MAIDCSSRRTGWPLSPRGPVPALPAIYNLHDKLSYLLTPSLVLPQHLTRSTLAISHPRASHQMRCILRCVSITYTPPLLTFTNLPEPPPLGSLVRDHVYQPLDCHRRPLQMRWCPRVYWELLLNRLGSLNGGVMLSHWRSVVGDLFFSHRPYLPQEGAYVYLCWEI